MAMFKKSDGSSVVASATYCAGKKCTVSITERLAITQEKVR